MSQSQINYKEFSLSQRFKMINWLIEILEGFKSSIYKDIGGNDTIGYGHHIMDQIEKDIAFKILNFSLQDIVYQGLNKDHACQLLAYDIIDRANISNYIKVDLTDHKWVALTSFCFNIGNYHFQKSHAYHHIHTYDFYQAADSLSSWRECQNQFSEGLAKRRLCEVMIFLEQPLDIKSSLLPSQQFNAPHAMPFTDENWTKLPLHLKEEALNIYFQYIQNFSLKDFLFVKHVIIDV